MTESAPAEIKKEANSEELRVYFASERTLLAWIRTGLAMMGFGFLVARFGLFVREFAAMKGETVAEGPGLSLWIGTALVLLGVAVNFFAAFQQIHFVRQLHQVSMLQRSRSSAGIAISLVLGALGMGMAVYLVLLG